MRKGILFWILYELCTAEVLLLPISACMQKTGYTFCTASNDASLNLTSAGYGYCCYQDSDPVCLKNSMCTSISTGTSMPLADKVTWMTFFPGLQTNHVAMCGTNLSLVATNQKQSLVVPIPSTSYSCEYRISVPSLTYRRSA